MKRAQKLKYGGYSTHTLIAKLPGNLIFFSVFFFHTHADKYFIALGRRVKLQSFEKIYKCIKTKHRVLKLGMFLFLYNSSYKFPVPVQAQKSLVLHKHLFIFYICYLVKQADS